MSSQDEGQTDNSSQCYVGRDGRLGVGGGREGGGDIRDVGCADRPAVSMQSTFLFVENWARLKAARGDARAVWQARGSRTDQNRTPIAARENFAPATTSGTAATSKCLTRSRSQS